MSYSRLDYFEECIATCAEENKIILEPAVIKLLAEAVTNGFENISQAFPSPDNSPLRDEIKELRGKLNVERNKTWCGECKGKGYLIFNGPAHSSESQCYKCGGSGKV